MITRFLSPQLAERAQPQTACKQALPRPGNLRPFPARKPVAAAAVAALLLGAAPPVAQHVAAQVPSEREVMEARGWIERAATPGDASTAIEVDETELPPDAPVIHVDEIIVPYDPNAREEIEPFDPHAQQQVGPVDGPAGEPATE